MRDVKGYEGLYQVSPSGDILSLEREITVERRGKIRAHCDAIHKIKQRILKPYLNKNSGYNHVTLHDKFGAMKTHSHHRLVCVAYHGEPIGDRICVNHIDGNRTNNHPDNLEWVSYSENSLHKRITNTMPTGEKHHSATISDKDAQWIRENYRAKTRKWGAIALANKFGVHRTTIENIAHGRFRSV